MRTEHDKLTAKDRSAIALIQRSPDIGDGWRQVSGALWAMMQNISPAALVEFDHEQKRVRLNGDGNVVARYL